MVRLIGDDIKLGAFETKKQAEIMAEFYINTFLGVNRVRLVVEVIIALSS